jgi:hypothetical protein
LLSERVHRLLDDRLAGGLNPKILVDFVNIVAGRPGGVDAFDLEDVTELGSLCVENKLVAVCELLFSDHHTRNVLNPFERDFPKLFDQLKQFPV